MPDIAVNLPSLLSGVVGGRKRIQVSAETVSEAFDDIKNRYPTLAVHLFDETGGLREHVLCFVNDTNTRWLDSLNHGLSERDSLTIIQAVSGG